MASNKIKMKISLESLITEFLEENPGTYKYEAENILRDFLGDQLDEDDNYIVEIQLVVRKPK